MTDKNIWLGFGTFTKRILPCIVHQDTLWGLSINVKGVMDKVWKITNLIRGGNRFLTHRKFETFLDELQA